MPWRLVGFTLLAVIFVAFIGFNLENRCDVSVGFYTFSQVPVFLTAFFTLALGMVLALPLAVSFRRAKARRAKEEVLDAGQNPASPKGFSPRTRGKRKGETGGSGGID